MSRPRSDDPIIDGLLSVGRDVPDGDGWGWDWEVDPRARAARDEINRLRAENEQLRGEVNFLASRSPAAVLAVAEREEPTDG